MERFQNQSVTTDKLTEKTVVTMASKLIFIHHVPRDSNKPVRIMRSILKRIQPFGATTMSVQRVNPDALIGGHNLTFGSYVSYAKTVFWILKMVVKGLV